MSDPEPARRLFKNARREALIVAVVWFLTLVWTVGYCFLFGYQHHPDSWVVQAGLAQPRQGDQLSQIGGFPGWVFWGIIVPWMLCSLFTILFGMYGMSDDDLGVEAQEEHGHGH